MKYIGIAITGLVVWSLCFVCVSSIIWSQVSSKSFLKDPTSAYVVALLIWAFGGIAFSLIATGIQEGSDNLVENEEKDEERERWNKSRLTRSSAHSRERESTQVFQ